MPTVSKGTFCDKIKVQYSFFKKSLHGVERARHLNALQFPTPLNIII